ncbi:hypothetical protein GCM10010166_52420 [Couchioplanes caeruleus subsp. azureus]|nr:hypothetical protein GCM10010166_52420 [Couchioplanes caeruleus subsp. azureus]
MRRRPSTGGAAHPEEIDEAASDETRAPVHGSTVTSGVTPGQRTVGQITLNSHVFNRFERRRVPGDVRTAGAGGYSTLSAMERRWGSATASDAVRVDVSEQRWWWT